MSKKLDRRSFLRRVGAAASVGALGVVAGSPARALQITDSDTGRNADPIGRGRGTGVTDSDTGRYASLRYLLATPFHGYL